MNTTSVQVRDELEALLERDLLGPWDGPEEELPPGVPPSERYLLGRLVPRTPLPPPGPGSAAEDAEPPRDPELIDRETMSTDDSGDTDVEPEATVRTGSLAASSLGLSFQVPDDVHAVVVRAVWGRYATGPSESQETPTGKPRRVWKRTPAGGAVEVRLDVPTDEPYVPDPAQENVLLRATVRPRGRVRIVDLALVNDQPAPSGSPDTARIYQVSLQVTPLDGAAAIFLGHNDPEFGSPPDHHDDERRALTMQYRSVREYAHGRQCAVDPEIRAGEVRAWRLTTTSFPSAVVPPVLPGDPATMPGVVLDMARLGSPELARDELVRSLRPLVAGYRRWLREQEGRLHADPELAAYGDTGAEAVHTARSVADRLERSLDLLRESGVAREAFRFANQAMALQRVRSEVVRARLSDPGVDLGELIRRYDVPEQRSWRPFQLAFVLLCLPGLADPAHPDAHRSADDAQAQLLFFPTGGGKTEAYLGLTAFTLAIRRLQGVVGQGVHARDGSDGVAVLMRYTLRLLTAQQFQRAAALICACEWLRRERIAGGDGRWGETPFRLGLWVGVSVTPNTYDNAKREVGDRRGYEAGVGGVLQLVACPWCGLSLSASRDLTSDDLRRRILLHCPDPDGDCPFSRRQSPREGVPVVTVDEELYRLTPALVISTVDKFAQLPWRAATATIFGQVDARCSRHGWHNPEFLPFCRTRHPAANGAPPTQLQPAMRLRPPDLVIQDELHLISDALGSMVGLYEVVIDDMCSRPGTRGPIRPVLVASTATVRRAADQVDQVFARGLTVFPPRVLDAGDTYFSTTVAPSEQTPGRRYRGICAPGETLKSVEIRVVAAVMEHAQQLFDRHGEAADPYLTVVDYFTSTRELAGMRRLIDDDVADRLSSQKVRTRRRRPNVSELTSRMPSARIASTLAELERPFDPGIDTSAALQRFRTDPAARENLSQRAQPIDVCLATSMLQVGVDVPRLGLMVVTGQPKNVAEYIQATSRVGRGRGKPGLVLTIFQWSRPRDLGHYERFGHNHATFGLRVEGITTTPFSDRALDRGLSAVLVAAVRHRDTANLPNPAAQDVPLTGPVASDLVTLLTARAARVTHVADQVELVRKQAQHRLDHWTHRRSTLPSGRLGYEEAADVAGLLAPPGEGSWNLWTAPRSLREVENEILLQLRPTDPSIANSPAWPYVREGD